MKQLLLTAVLALVFAGTSYSQYSKEEVNKMLAEFGTTEASIKTLYVGNVKEFYTSGNNKYTYDKYKGTYDGGTNKFFIDAQGVTVKSYKEGALAGVRTFNYKYIRILYVKKDYIEVHLAN